MTLIPAGPIVGSCPLFSSGNVPQSQNSQGSCIGLSLVIKEPKDGLSAAHPNAGIYTQAGEDLPSLGRNNIRKKGSSIFQNKFSEDQ